MWVNKGGPLVKGLFFCEVKNCQGELCPFVYENQWPKFFLKKAKPVLSLHTRATTNPHRVMSKRYAFLCFTAFLFQAQAQARALAHYVTRAAGGFGAAREFCDLLLVAGGHYATLLEQATGHTR